MAETEVLIPHDVEEEFPGRVEAVAPGIKVIVVEEDGSTEGASSPRVLLRGSMSSEAMQRVLREYPTVEWVHAYSAGVEQLLPELGDFAGTVTNSAGVHGEPIAEWVVAMLFAHAKRLPLLLQHHAAHEWQAEKAEELGGKTLGIVGAGGIGAAIARRARGLDMEVVGVRSSGQATEHIRRMYTPDRLHEMLGECDYVVLAVPLTPDTEGMIGEPELRAMQPSSVLLNIARGKVVQTEALLRALTEGWIGGAYLDVTDPEPLPHDHPLWDAPNTLITAHTSGYSPHSSRRTLELFCENLRRFVSGEELLNVVDKARGY
ncbi:MAG: D-2-hydroxyacid dehydrogenase [Chloroflexota bacterium]|nr:D-2-hydroxyacid dehydrogenase [Chloroflexota bacterium]